MKIDPSFDSLISEAVRCARDMWLNGWAENGAGNLSVRLGPELPGRLLHAHNSHRWFDIGCKRPELGGSAFLMTARGSFFRCLRHRPSQGLGVIVLDGRGEHYKMVWGFEGQGAPSSEIQSHLSVQGALACGDSSAVVHVHAPNVIALTCSAAMNTVSLTRLLWSLHSECIALFPEGVEVAPWRLPGSAELSMETGRAFMKRRLMVWPFHGVVAAGRSLDEAVGLIETVEKASGIYLKALAAGGPNAWLTEHDLRSVAAHFGVVPDEEILGSKPPGPDGAGA